MSKPQQKQMSARQIDLMVSKMLREQTPLYQKTLGTYTGALGQTLRAKLANVGLTTRVFAKVTVNTTIGTATAALNAKGLEAFVPRVSLSDYDGTLRANLSAYHLKLRNSLRKKWNKLHGESPVFGVDGLAAGANGRRSAITNDSFNGAVATNDQTFIIELPICRDLERGDLRGILNTQTTQGDVFFNLDFCSSANVLGSTIDDEKVLYSATGTCAVNSINVEIVQEYYMIQQINGMVTLPQYSSAVVYALEGFTRTSDNIAAGTDKLVAFPNARVISGVYASYYNNSKLAGGTAQSATDLTRLKLIANAGNYLKDLSIAMQYFLQRESAGFDFNAGVYFLDFEPAPIQTDVYGNVQLAVTPGATVSSPNIEVTWESLYLKGAALSGISQSS